MKKVYVVHVPDAGQILAVFKNEKKADAFAESEKKSWESSEVLVEEQEVYDEGVG